MASKTRCVGSVANVCSFSSGEEASLCMWRDKAIADKGEKEAIVTTEALLSYSVFAFFKVLGSLTSY